MKASDSVQMMLLLGATCGLLMTPRAAAEETTSSDRNAEIPLRAEHRMDTRRLFPDLQREGGSTTISMTVGTVPEVHRAVWVAPHSETTASLPAAKPGDSLLLGFVIPTDREGHLYHVELRSKELLFACRSGATQGFGKRTMFIPVPTALIAQNGSLEISIRNRGEQDLYLSELSLLRGFDRFLSTASAGETFTLSLLVNDTNATPQLELVRRLPSAEGVEKALGLEYYYAARSEAELRKQAEESRRNCDTLGVSFVPIVCSWWAGTPPEVMRQTRFQQICWSKTDTHDEGENLRRLLGDRWDLRYGLTIPNKWSNTPWPTMNSAELNQLRRERLTRAVSILEEKLEGRLSGYVTENEPAYWAFEGSDHEYPVRREELWADFNPLTVADAERDGVMLDPADGLDMTERVWLHNNVARYNQETVNWIAETSPTGRVYSHALLDYTHFPMAGTGRARSYADVARVRNARTGVEILWKTDTDALWRVREWGRWACVNREEWDGYPITYHLATLRACYMLGADMLNSYNWQSMGREGDPFEYFSTFLREVGEGQGLVTVAQRSSGTDWRPIGRWDAGLIKNDPSPWANGIELTLRAKPGSDPLRVWLTDQIKGPIVAYRLVSPEDLAREGPTRIPFGDYTRLHQERDLHLWLEAPGEGWEMLGSFWGPNYRVLLDLKEERRRSLYVIDRPAEVPTAPAVFADEPALPRN